LTLQITLLSIPSELMQRSPRTRENKFTQLQLTFSTGFPSIQSSAEKEVNFTNNSQDTNIDLDI